jgi:enoyl-CoA hydratase/carnithine racemase
MARVLPGYDVTIALSDAELEQRLDRLVHRVDVHDEDLANDLWTLIDELTERHAPQIARMSLERIYAEDRDGELENAMEAMREREGARLIRRALEGESD